MQEYNNHRHMNVLISADKKYLSKYKTMLYSLKKYNSDFKVYFLNKSLSSRKIKKFKKYLKKKINCDCVVVDMDESLYEKLPINIKRISLETYSRLFAQFCLPEELDRIMWLDADVICLKNVEDIYFQEFDNKSIIGTIDISEDRVKTEYQDKIGLDLGEKHHYINAGIIILNLKKIRETTTVKSVLKLCAELKDSIKFQDQDIINVLYKGDMKYETKYFNYPLFYTETIEEKELEKVRFFHFVEAEKPWRIKSHNAFSKYWWDIEIERGNRIKYYSYLVIRGIYMGIRKIYLKIRGI